MASYLRKVSSFLKRAAVVAVGLAAVFAAGGARAATRQFGEIVVNKVNEVVSSFDVGFAATTDETPSTLIMAWGATDGGDTTNNWENVKVVGYVMPADVTKHIAAPDGCGISVFHARFFLASGTAVPYDTRYESFQRNGQGYFDTGFIPNQDTRVVADITVHGLEYWFGAWREAYHDMPFAIRWEITSPQKVYCGYGGHNAFTKNMNIQVDKRYVLDFNKNVISMTCTDGTLGFPTNNVGIKKFSSSPNSLYLWAFHEGVATPKVETGGNTTFHGCTIYDNGVKVRDYIPVSKDGVYYMFDLVNCVLNPFSAGMVPIAGAVVTDDPLGKGAGPVYAASKKMEFEDIGALRVLRWDPAATGTGDGKSWENAYTDINAAIKKAGVFKGEVWIKGGTYAPAKSLILCNNVAVMGGFDGGTYASEDAERAARDPKGNPTVFSTSGTTQVNLDSAGSVDQTAIVDGIQFRNTSGWLVYASSSGASMAYPLFTNCTFVGRAINLQRAAATFYGCRFENLKGGSYGQIFLENTSGAVNFTDCTFVNTTNSVEYGMINYAGSSSGGFQRCRFEGCVGTSTSGPATIHQHAGGTVAALDHCVFVGCRGNGGGGGIVHALSMNDCRFEGCGSSANFLQGIAGRIERTSFVSNVVSVSSPGTTSGTNHVAILNATNSRTTLVNCTFDGNACEATYGEGATVVRSTVRWALAGALGGAVNCTFRNNAVDHDLTACSIGSGNDVQLVNVVTSNADSAYRAIRTYGTSGGFCAYSSYLQGFAYDQGYAYLRLYDDIRTDDPRCERKFVDDGLHRVVRLGTNSSAKRRRVRNVEVGANGVLRFKDANGSYNYTFCSSTAPTTPIALIADMLGNERPDGEFVPGSCQELKPFQGLTLIVR